MRIVAFIDLAKYIHIKLNRIDALNLLNVVTKKHGTTRDLEEAKRIVLNFSEYYDIARKFDGYLTIIKDPADSIRGRVIVHRIKLLRENSEEFVELILDRRISRELVISALKEIGFSNVEFANTQ